SWAPRSGDPDAQAGLPEANIGAAYGPKRERQAGANKSMLILMSGAVKRSEQMDPGFPRFSTRGHPCPLPASPAAAPG
ncbi:MAG: hypothetical protein WBW92_05010, partial [Rhodanobacteraceae bacterium]